MIISILPSLALLANSLVSAVPYSEYILAPESRTIYPFAIHKINGSVSNAAALIGDTGG
jgi:hypothetical protein